MAATAAEAVAACQALPGNADLYGIGIRLGVYLSWYATLIANAFVASRVEDVSDTNTLFVVANFVALASHSYNSDLNVIDVYIVLAIFFGYIFGGWSLAGLRLGTIYHAAPLDLDSELCCADALDVTCSKQIRVRPTWVVEIHESFSQVGIFIRLALALAIAAYAVWFSFSGAQQLGPIACAPTVFLFGHYPFFGAVNTFLKVLTTGVLLMLFLVTLPLVYVFVKAILWNLLLVFACFLCMLMCQDQEAKDKSKTEAELEAARKKNQSLNRQTFCVSCGSGCLAILLGLNSTRKTFFGSEMEAGRKSRGFGNPTADHILDELGLGSGSSSGFVTSYVAKWIASVIKNWRYILAIGGLLIVIWITVVIELTIAYNGMYDINHLPVTSQLIPFVVGLGLFLTVIHRLIIESLGEWQTRRSEPKEEEASSGPTAQVPGTPHADSTGQGDGTIVTTQPPLNATMSVPDTGNHPSTRPSSESGGIPSHCVLKRTASGRAYLVDKQARTTRWVDEPPVYDEE